MAVMDEFKEEREALKNGTPKQRLAYFWYYYKWHVIISIAAVVLVISFIYEIATQKDSAFYGVFVNAWAQEEKAPEYLQGFADQQGIDTEKYDVSIDSSLYIKKDSMDQSTVTSTQKLMVYIAASEIDVIASDDVTFEHYANNNTFYDLREILTPEQIEKYEPYFYYIDQSVVDEKDAAMNEMDDSYVPVYPDPSRPGEMEDPVPVAFYVGENQGLLDAYYFAEGDVVLGIVGNTTRLEEAVAFVEYIFEHNE